MKKNDIEVHSPFAISDCKAKLAAAIDDTRRFLDGRVANGNKEMAGSIYEDSFRVQVRSRGFNSFRPILYAQLISENSGTRITGKFRWHPITRVLTILWLIGVTFFSIASTVEILALKFNNIPPILFFPYVMLLIGVLGARPGAAEVEEREAIGRFVRNVTT